MKKTDVRRSNVTPQRLTRSTNVVWKHSIKISSKIKSENAMTCVCLFTIKNSTHSQLNSCTSFQSKKKSNEICATISGHIARMGGIAIHDDRENAMSNSQNKCKQITRNLCKFLFSSTRSVLARCANLWFFIRRTSSQNELYFSMETSETPTWPSIASKAHKKNITRWPKTVEKRKEKCQLCHFHLGPI